MLDRVNYFEPYQRKKAGSEEALSRAFLALIRLVPTAHQEFLELVREQQRAHDYQRLLPRLTSVDGEIRVDAEKRSLGIDEPHVVSVLLTNEPVQPERSVERRDGEYVLDGRLTYGQMLMILENKLSHTSVWTSQLDIPPSANGNASFESRPALVVLWRDVIEQLHLLREGELLGVTGMRLVGDFLAYVEEYHDSLNPFPTIQRCKRSPDRICRRMRVLLSNVFNRDRVEVSGDGVPYVRLRGRPAQRAYCGVKVETDEVTHLALDIYPGDTVTQARALYKNVDWKSLEELMENGFQVEPNFHLQSLNNRILRRASSDISLADYFDYWTKHARNETGLIGRVDSSTQEIVETIDQLVDDGQIPRSEQPRVKAYFEESNAMSLDVDPGLRVGYTWPISDAEALDDRGELGDAVCSISGAALACWGQSLPERTDER